MSIASCNTSVYHTSWCAVRSYLPALAFTTSLDYYPDTHRPAGLHHMLLPLPLIPMTGPDDRRQQYSCEDQCAESDPTFLATSRRFRVML